jgi:hypothetical protein
MGKYTAVVVDEPENDATLPKLRIMDVELPAVDDKSVLVKMLLRPINPAGKHTLTHKCRIHSIKDQVCSDFLGTPCPRLMSDVKRKSVRLTFPCNVECELAHASHL